MHKTHRIIAFLVTTAFLQACTWVKPTPEGQKVSVLQANQIGAWCERKGEVASVLKSRVAGVERSPTKVAKELETLARNEAALMGGDAIVAQSDVKDGRQLFGVYRCGRTD